MNKHYHHLTQMQRAQIEILIKNGHSQTEIAKLINVSKSTISRELRRNTCFIKKGYDANSAQERSANKRRAASSQKGKIQGELKEIILEKLESTDASPMQIAGYVNNETNFKISHETIYKYIWKDKKEKGFLFKKLRHQGKKYQKRSKAGRSHIPNRVSIHERPKIVEKKERIGDFEGDLIIGKDNSGVILSLVDRASKYTILVLLKGKTKEEVGGAIVSHLIEYKGILKTITFDNGGEFAGHEKISEALGVQCYFCDPYKSSQRGLNEHINGNVRQYYPKNARFDTLGQRDMEDVMFRLNHRPRKSLNFKTAHSVFTQKNCVALRA